MIKLASITKAAIRRAIKASPDRVVEITYPDGTIVRFEPNEDKKLVAEKREVRL